MAPDFLFLVSLGTGPEEGDRPQERFTHHAGGRPSTRSGTSASASGALSVRRRHLGGPDGSQCLVLDFCDVFVSFLFCLFLF